MTDITPLVANIYSIRVSVLSPLLHAACMDDILPKRYFNHVLQLVTACFILNKDSISHHDLRESERLMNKFHSEFMSLYSKFNKYCPLLDMYMYS